MRFRVVEKDGRPSTVAFTFDGRVYCFVKGRRGFQEMSNTLEGLTVAELPFREGSYSLGPIREYQVPPHPLQGLVAESGEYLPAEMIEETHINLLKLLREEAGGVTLPRVMP